MNRKLVIAIVSVLLLTAAGASSLAEAAQAARDTGGTELKADENRTKQLRHGYIRYDKNKVYYYW